MSKMPLQGNGIAAIPKRNLKLSETETNNRPKKNKSNSLLQTLSKQQNKIKLVLIIFEIFCHFRTDPSEIFFSADPIFEAEKSYHHPDNRQPKEKEGEEEEAQTEDKNKNEVV